MGWKKALLPGLCFGTSGVGLFGFITIPWSGGQVMIGGHPIDPLFLEAGSLFLFLAGGMSLCIFLVGWTVGSLKRIRDITVYELEQLQKCGEEQVDWASKAQAAGTMPRLEDLPSAETRLRFSVLLQKYKNWGIEIPTRQSVGDYVLSAAKCAETIRWHGYVKGRFMLWQDRRKFRKEIAANER